MENQLQRSKQNGWKNIRGVAMGIVAFEGTEHLYNIISEVRDLVDFVFIGAQRVSYHGDPMPAEDMAEIIRLRDEDKLVDEIMFIETDLQKKPRMQETDKRNAMMEKAQANGCSHCIIIDSDEFYTRASFLRGLKSIDENGWRQTYCRYQNYYHDYQHYLIYPFEKGMYVPWVSEACFRFSWDCKDFPKPSDPTRRYIRPKNDKGEYTVDWHEFAWNEVKMHHLSWLRADIRKKLNMWSSKTLFDNWECLIDRAVLAFQKFDQDPANNDQAVLLFNTPGNKVEIEDMGRAYIRPKTDYMTRVRQLPDKKRILFLCVAANADSAKTCLNTWAKQLPAECEFWTVAGHQKNTKIDNKSHCVFVKNEKDARGDADAEAWRISEAWGLLGEKFDWLVTFYPSTWIDAAAMKRMVENTRDDSIVFGSYDCVSKFSAWNLYMDGCLASMSSRQAGLFHKKVSSEKLVTDRGIGVGPLMSLVFGRHAQSSGAGWIAKSSPLGVDRIWKDFSAAEDIPENASKDCIACDLRTWTNSQTCVLNPAKMKVYTEWRASNGLNAVVPDRQMQGICNADEADWRISPAAGRSACELYAEKMREEKKSQYWG